MKNIISKLYDGEIFPSEQIVSNDPRYWPMIRNISRERELLKAKLEKKDADRLEALSEQYYEVSSMSCYANFAYGFRLGMLLMYEIWNGQTEIGPNDF